MHDRLGLRTHGDVGADALSALGLDPARVVDFAVNVNPFGPHPDVIAAARAAALDRYPETTGRRAREALAQALDVPAEAIVLGNGAADLLWTAARAFASRERPTLVVGPTFSELPAAVAQLGGEVVEVRAHAEDDFAIDLDRILAHAKDCDPALAYVCNPNNPTGRAWSPAELVRLATSAPRTRFLLDEAFLSLSERHADARAPLPPNVIRVRSMTKDHALPGLRPAYAIATPDDAAVLERSRPAWPTSAPLQAAVIACASRPEHVARSREALLGFRRELASRLAAAGLRTVPSTTIFQLVDVGDADAVRARLLEHGVLVRSCTSFGLPRFLRVCARPSADVDRLLGALREVLR